MNESEKKMRELFEDWVSRYFECYVDLETSPNGDYRSHETYDMFQAFKAGYEKMQGKECCKQKEPGWRAFKNGEMPLKYLDYIYCYRKKGSKLYYKPICYNWDATADAQLQFNYGGEWRWFSHKQLFETRLVLIDDKWQPVGVREG